MERQELLSSPEYQLTKIQLDLYFKLVHYMETKGFTHKEAAKQLNTKRRVIKKTLNGDFNYSLETFITLANAIGYNIEITFNKK